MNKDLIETPRFNFFIGDEVFLKGKIVGFDVDENKCVENVVRLGYGQILNVPNNDIYITDDIVDKSKIKVTIPQSVADWIRKCKTFKSFAVSLSFALQPSVWEANGLSDESIEWLANAENQEIFARAWLDDYDIQETKYVITDGNHLYFKKCQEDIEIVILVDEQPGTMEYVKKFDTKEEAQEIANILGWKVQEVE
ncbi:MULTISPECIES: DUF1642 domain-containing protein [Streptococcus]|uniref:DUF1642 domain-containing protein n=1 Tax=Streptococcus TaxID=1301 RepID=UPI000A10890A|nr:MULTISPECIES: DUF1642 domain-containing protein [Streptococcus]VFI55545.1 Protein of uncharacterised function (DUF1642) [Streptococcus pneumoniae]VQF99825.1 Protein of uncharacterised function (DUF1642) [Streptococcus pneumoniae]